MAQFDTDVVVVGAGAVGLATAWAFARAGRSVVVLEREHRIGQGVSSRNSEVIHAGLYYATDLLRARLCVSGRRQLYAFLERHGVPVEKCGKLVVATSAQEVEAIERVAAQAGVNGVENLRWLSREEVARREPQLRAEVVLLSEETGIFDSHGYMLALQGEIEAAGGAVVLDTPFEGAVSLPGGGFEVRAGGADPTRITSEVLVISAGLGAQACAGLVEGYPRERIKPLYLGKGSYFVVAGKAPFHHLVYPPPIVGALGLHYKRDMGGRAHFGPDLQWVETEDYAVDPARAEFFYEHVRRFWPGLPDGALSADYAGIRPKLHGPGEPQPDFDIDGPEGHGIAGLVVMLGMESPGLTASLAIGEEVLSRASGR